jgi:hypothetical protein
MAATVFLKGGLGYLSIGFRSCCSLIISFPCASEGASDAAAPAATMPAPPTTVRREIGDLLSVVISQFRW